MFLSMRIWFKLLRPGSSWSEPKIFYSDKECMKMTKIRTKKLKSKDVLDKAEFEEEMNKVQS